MRTLLEFRHVSSGEPGAPCIQDVSFSMFEGEFIALVGADYFNNLQIMNILNGTNLAYKGQVLFQGRKYAAHSLNEANDLGIFCITQSCGLFDRQTIAENFFIHTGRTPLFQLTQEELYNRKTQALMERYGLNFSPTDRVEQFSENVKCILTMIKYANLGARLIVLSNAMRGCAPNERELFLRVARQITASGAGILFLPEQCVSFLDRIDRVLVLSLAGRLVKTIYAEELELEQLRTYLADSRSNRIPKPRSAQPGREILRAEGFTDSGEAKKLILREGEILGLLSQKTESTANSRVSDDGLDLFRCKLWIDGKPVRIRDEADALRYGIGLIPGTLRKIYCPDLSILENALIPFLNRPNGSKGIVRRSQLRALQQDAELWFDRIKREFGYRLMDACVYSVFIRFLLYPYRIIVFFQPEKVNDIRRNSMIYWLIDALVQKNCTLIIISANQKELNGLANTVHEMIQPSQPDTKGEDFEW